MRYAFHVTGASMRLTSAVAASPCPAMLVVMLLYQNRSSSIRAQGMATGRGEADEMGDARQQQRRGGSSHKLKRKWQGRISRPRPLPRSMHAD